MRPTLRTLSTVGIIAGLVLLADALLTVVWQEPITALITKTRQDRLADDLRGLLRAGPSQAELAALGRLPRESQRIAYLAGALRRRADGGQAVGRVRIPRMGADFILVNGSQPDHLRRGPGLYDDRPFPGERGTVAIAGHRTWFQAPFRNIQRLRAGDRVEVEMPYATFAYVVEGHEVVEPAEVGVLKQMLYDRLVLSACHPRFSADKRWVVFARLQEAVLSEAVTAAAAGGSRSNRRRRGFSSTHPPTDTHRESQNTRPGRGGA